MGLIGITAFFSPDKKLLRNKLISIESQQIMLITKFLPLTNNILLDHNAYIFI